MTEGEAKQYKRLNRGDIRRLKRHGIEPEELKDSNARLDLFKDARGDVYVMPKDGSGPGEPTGINLEALE